MRPRDQGRNEMAILLSKLKEIPQSLWLGDFGYSKNGVFFYMSEYVEKTIWAKGSYEDAISAARTCVPTSIMKAAKAKNLSNRTGTKFRAEAQGYGAIAITTNKIFRIGLWCGKAAGAPSAALGPPGAQNHAAVVAANGAGKVLFFEPNFGFYEASEMGTAQQTLLQNAIGELYNPNGGAADPTIATNFVYLAGRKLG